MESFNIHKPIGIYSHGVSVFLLQIVTLIFIDTPAWVTRQQAWATRRVG